MWLAELEMMMLMIDFQSKQIFSIPVCIKWVRNEFPSAGQLMKTHKQPQTNKTILIRVDRKLYLTKTVITDQWPDAQACRADLSAAGLACAMGDWFFSISYVRVGNKRHAYCVLTCKYGGDLKAYMLYFRVFFPPNLFFLNIFCCLPWLDLIIWWEGWGCSKCFLAFARESLNRTFIGARY